MLPEMNGYAAMKKLQEYEESDIPILAVKTPWKPRSKKVWSLGSKRHLSEPINIKNLFIEIDRFLKPEDSPLMESSR